MGMKELFVIDKEVVGCTSVNEILHVVVTLIELPTR